MTTRRSDAFRDVQSAAQNTAIGANAIINVRTGVNAGTGGQGILLASLTGNAAGWGASVNGVLTSSAITEDSSANATGTAAHYELLTQGSVFLESGLLDGSDGVTIDNTSIVTGQTVQASGNWVNTQAYDDGV